MAPERREFDHGVVEAALSLARFFGAKDADAEDIAQDALLKLIIHRDTVADPVAWLYVVVRRLCRRHLASEGRRRALGRRAVLDPWPVVDLSIDTERHLRRCTKRARESLCLALAGYTERETATRLGCSIKATEKALHKARRELRAILRAATKETEGRKSPSHASL